MNRQKTKGPFYRSRDGILFGLCRGASRYFNFPLFWIRAAAVFTIFVTGFWPAVIAYLVASMVTKPEPILPLNNESESEFYGSYIQSRTMAVQRLKKKYGQMQNRLQRLESHVTSRRFQWEQKLRE